MTPGFNLSFSVKNQSTEGSHDTLLIFLYGAACGAGVLILIISLLFTVSCCLKKQRRKRSHGEKIETAQETGDYITTARNLPEETQNETRREVAVYDYPYTFQPGSSQTLMPPPYLADIARGNDAGDLEDAEPFARSHQYHKKSLKPQKHPVNGNSKNEGRVYMHLIPETRQGNETSNLTTKSSKRSRRRENETCATKPGVSGKLRETNKPTSTRAEVRPSSAAYVNGHLTKLYSNVR